MAGVPCCKLAEIWRLAAQANALQIVAQQHQMPLLSLVRRLDGKMDANSALGANSDVQMIHGVSLSNSGGNLQQPLASSAMCVRVIDSPFDSCSRPVVMHKGLWLGIHRGA